MTKQVKFYWWATVKIWNVKGSDLDDIVQKCHELATKYHARHFEVL